MAVAVVPARLREYLAEALHEPGARVAVEYYRTKRDPLTARAADKAARWLRRRGRGQGGGARVVRVDVDAGGAAGARRLEAMGVRLLPQPSTVVIYGAGGRVLGVRAGPLLSSLELVRQLRANPG